LNYKAIKITKFQKLEAVSVFRQKSEDERKAICCDYGLRPGLRLAQPEGLADRLSVLFPTFYLKTEAESSFREDVILASKL
jgi:hypothetical protein